MPKKNTTQRRQAFERLIEKAEAFAAENPAAYRKRVMLLGLLGYAVVIGLLLLLIGILGGSITLMFTSSVFLILLLKKKLIVPLVLIVYVIARALWVRVESPPGYRLNPVDFPKLFGLIDALQKRLKTPPIHEVILSPEFNAAIYQTPRLGPIGLQQNTLILGLPLLMAMSSDQAKAVLAHEMGHLSGNHGRFFGWIYRLRLTWYHVMDAFDHTQVWGSGFMRRFFNWYAPHFNAYSFVLARDNEYMADAMSAKVTSVKQAALALVNARIQSGIADEYFWRPLLTSADTQPDIITDPFQRLARFYREYPLERAEVLSRIRKAIAEKTSYTDTHPSLNDRLKALKAPPVLPQTVEKTAAESWLGNRYLQILKDFDEAWVENNREAWLERYKQADKNRYLLRSLQLRPLKELSAEEHWNLASWTLTYDNNKDALPFFQAYYKRWPKDPDGALAVGRLLLERNEAKGLAYLEQVIDTPNVAIAACSLAYDYFNRNGDEASAESWRRRAERQMDVLELAQSERETLNPRDKFVACAVTEEVKERLGDALYAQEKITQGWIACKQVEHLPDSPVHVVAYETKGPFINEGKINARLLEDIELPGTVFVVRKGGEHKEVAKKIIQIGQTLL